MTRREGYKVANKILISFVVVMGDIGCFAQSCELQNKMRGIFAK
jgi:hypothetical protein